PGAEGQLPVGGLLVHEQFLGGPVGVVDQPGEFAEGAHGQVDGRLGDVGPGHIPLEEHHGLTQVVCECPAGGRIDVDDDHVRAACDELTGGSRADAPGAAGDDDDVTLELC